MTQTASSPSTPNRVAIVTGASRGIGLAIAERLVQDGLSVAITYANRQHAADKAIAGLRERAPGAQAIAIRADLRDRAAAPRVFAEVREQLGRVDVLVNNAGIAMPNATPVAETTDELWDEILATNTTGAFVMLREAARSLAQGGRIINISTSVTALLLPGYSAYAASKAALEALTPILAKELRGRSITVNTVSPGPVATELFTQGKTQEQIQHFAKMPPLERLGEPRDIAQVVAFLVSEAGGWVNGQNIRANGGII